MDDYEHLYSWENLRQAHRKASRGKRGKSPAASFEMRLADNLLHLQVELREQSYRPGAYHSFFIHEPKRRLISAAPFRDRVIHHALCNIIEPRFERSFVYDSYANRVGKGTHAALDRAQHFAQRFPYVLQCDVEQFFPAIDHAILQETLARKIHDPRVLWLIDRILEGGAEVLSEQYTPRYFPGDDLFARARARGLPIGNLTSQFWANCYLNPYDHFVKRELRCGGQRGGYVRYVDDMLLFASDKRTLWAWRAALIERMARLRLTIHPGAHPRPVTEGIPFLGFVIYPTHRRLKYRQLVAYRRRLRHKLADYVAGEETREAVAASILGWINHTRYGNTWGLRRAILEGVTL